MGGVGGFTGVLLDITCFKKKREKKIAHFMDSVYLGSLPDRFSARVPCDAA